MKAISQSTKETIIYHLKNGKSIRQISAITGISKSTVHNARKCCLADLTKSKGGRAPKLSLRDVTFCIKSITSGESQTAQSVSKKLKEYFSISASRKTVARALVKSGMKAGVKQKKPKLSLKNVKARLDFAKQHKDWTLEDWRHVIWSDETKINRFGSDGRSWYWKHENESRNPRHIQQTVKHGGGSIMIWGCMTADGPGNMCKIEGIMDQHLYKSILQEDFLETVDWYGLELKNIIFQQDNDSKHKSKIVRDWLVEQSFSILEWPAQSPDLNPIEHLWSHLKNRLNSYSTPANGMIELWQRIEDEWNKIDKTTCLNLIESMPRRIEAVLKAKGYWTDY